MQHLNRKEFPCQEDPEYNIQQCLEDYVETKVRCKSPWDQFPSAQNVVICLFALPLATVIIVSDTLFQTKKCKSMQELDALRQIHVDLYTMNAYEFRMYTGCLRPCMHQTFTFNRRTMVSKAFHSSIPAGENFTVVSIGLYSANERNVTETYLYSETNLVGEVGGAMGLFLGISLVTVYEALIGLMRKTWISWSKKK